MIHVVGEILVDIFRDGETEQVFPGGAPFNVATNIKHFGGETTFYGCIGKDEYGTFLTKFARKQHFNSLILKTCLKRSTTQAIVSLKNGERSFKFVRENGADYVLSIKNLEKLNIQKGDIVHIGSLMFSYPRGRKFYYKAVEYAKAKGALISFDVNYRDDIFENSETAKRIYKKAMKFADILKISDEELKILSTKKTLKGKVKSLTNKNQIVFVSRGQDGSILFYKDKVISVVTKSIVPVDTTGAGDAFYSYCLFELNKKIGLIDSNENIIKMLTYANAVGAIATQKKGAIGVVPTIAELNKYLGE